LRMGRQPAEQSTPELFPNDRVRDASPPQPKPSTPKATPESAPQRHILPKNLRGGRRKLTHGSNPKVQPRFIFPGSTLRTVECGSLFSPWFDSPSRAGPAAPIRERSLHTGEVVGSIPTAPTSNIKDLTRSVLESAHVSPMKSPLEADPFGKRPVA
jgi:hypothetical protein